ncbi:MAG: extracellular solute-binding protein [Chloroflexi bacterium]|nr:extracellular solute-binding protein [Chloroflexota bacterium]
MPQSTGEAAMLVDSIARHTRSRRALLRLMLGTAATTAVSSVLAACSTNNSQPSTGAAAPTAPATQAPTAAPKPAATTAPANAAATSAPAAATSAPAAAATSAPAAASADGVIPSPAPDVPEAYLKLPTPFQSVNAVPGKGSKVTAAFISYNAPVPARDQNPYWQELEKRLGITYEPNIIPADSYREKMAALVAGGDLPDITVVEQLNAPELLKTINQGAFTDLTPLLEGDALKQFPNLARLPDYGWKNVRIKQKIYGVPIVRFIPDRAMIFRGDWIDKLGGSPPTNADELLTWLQRFPKENPGGVAGGTFALGSWTGLYYAFPFFTMMFRAPHMWRQNPDGTLTHAVETQEFRQAVEYMKRLNDAGVFHPDAASMSIQNAKDGFLGGKFAGYVDGWTAIVTHRMNFRQVDPSNSAAVILVPPGFDGGNPAVERSQGFFGMSCIPASVGKDQERVKQLLRIIDYCTAPFGSEEYTFLRWGIQGVHYDLQNGAPIPNDKGRTEIGALSSGIGRRNDVFYFPDAPDDARLMQGWCKDQLAHGIDNPTYGLYSPAAISSAGDMQNLMTDRLTAIISGREPLSSYDQFVADWRSRGGDQMRTEYQQALKA